MEEGGGSYKVLSHLSVFFISVLGASCQQKLKSPLRVINNRTENLFPLSALKGCAMLISASAEPALGKKGSKEEVLTLVSWLKGDLEQQQEAIMLY